MPTQIRKLGVEGGNLPTLKSSVVATSPFNIGGIVGQFERKYRQAFLVHNATEKQQIFGNQISSSWYGDDMVTAFFSNVKGVDASLYIKAHVGNTGSAIDAVVASATINDTDSVPAPTIKISAAYQTVDEYGTHGNRVGYKITNGARFTTALNGAASTGDLFVAVDSVAGVRVGDVVDFIHSSTHTYKKITSIDQSTGRLYFGTAFGSSAYVDGDVVNVLGVKVQVYEKDINGIVREVNPDIGRIYCTLSPEVTDFYIDNVFQAHNYVKIVSQAHTSTLEKQYPANVSTATYLIGGADGTAPSTAAHWLYENLAAFNTLPVRILGNAETTLQAVNLDGENYCRGRWDNPKWLYNIPSNQSKSQLQTIGASYQRADDVLGVIMGQWLQVSDPFASSPIAPPREVPSIGVTMGAWLRSIAVNGVHYIPAIKQIPIYGAVGVVGTQFPDNQDRTDIAEYGVNLFEQVSGYGIIMRNFFTPSTTLEYQFANGIMMRSMYEVSGVDSLQSSENLPNSLNRIKADGSAMEMYMRRQWERGNTGTVPDGETFGQTQNTDGTATVFGDHVQIQADIINNPQDAINRGERNIDFYFTYPAPAGSIRIRGGFMLRS